MRSPRSHTRIFMACLLALAVFVGCSDVNCPLNNSVYATWSFYQNNAPLTLSDTLNIYLRINGRDSLAANRLYNLSRVGLPMSYYNEADTLTFEVRTQSHRTYKDMVIVKKVNVPHFNSPECGTWVEHYVQDVALTHNRLDSITVTNTKVDNNETENFRLYFK